ncbi:MAG: PucR family transcriptional regulator [Lachnospiraceae bacterium]
MISNQVIQNSIDDLKTITKVDFCVFEVEGRQVASTFEKLPFSEEAVDSFADSKADSQVLEGCHFLKILDDGQPAYILIAKGPGDDVYMLAKIAVAQIQNLIVAYKERFDRNNFFQSLLLDNLLLVDIYNRAQKMHIEVEKKRIVYLIETKMDKDNLVMELLKSIFLPQSGDYVTAVDERNVILIKELSPSDGAAQFEETANTIVDMLNTEAMLNVRVAYGIPVNELKDVSKSYKEAKMALDVGSIFYSYMRVISYETLGIGRLIYQLPVNLCRIFVKEVFGEVSPDEIDEEILITVNKFFENNLNVSETSRQLYIHRNTLVYRIEKLQKAIGLDMRKFEDALTFKIAMMVVDYMKYLDAQE